MSFFWPDKASNRELRLWSGENKATELILDEIQVEESKRRCQAGTWNDFDMI